MFGYVSGNDQSVIEECSSSANISATHTIGGLIGWADNLTLRNSSNEGSTVTATGFLVDGTNNYAYLGGYIGSGASVSGCTNDCDITYNSLGNLVGGVIGYATGNIYNCTNNGDIFSLGNCVGGIAGWVLNSVPASNTNYARNLVNNGEIKGVDNVGGIFGAFLHELEYGSCGGYRFTITVSAFQNNATVIGNNQVGGIVGNLYFNNSQDYYCKNHSSWSHHHTYSYCELAATDMVNIGAVNGMTYVGEIFGNFWSDGNSTLTTYTILGSIIVNRETLEGEYAVGSNTRLTLSDRVIPEEETPEETPDTPAEE